MLFGGGQRPLWMEYDLIHCNVDVDVYHDTNNCIKAERLWPLLPLS